MDDDYISRIKAALDAGPTPGPWFAVNIGTGGEPFMSVKAERISGRGPTHEVALCATGDSPQRMENANSAFIAACNPVAIRALLDRLKAAEDNVRKANAQAELFEREWYLRGDEIERLRAELDALGVAIADAGYTWTPEMRAAYEKGKK